MALDATSGCDAPLVDIVKACIRLRLWKLTTYDAEHARTLRPAQLDVLLGTRKGKLELASATVRISARLDLEHVAVTCYAHLNVLLRGNMSKGEDHLVLLRRADADSATAGLLQRARSGRLLTRAT